MLTIKRTKPYKRISIWLVSLASGFVVSYALLELITPTALPVANDPIDGPVSVLGVSSVKDQHNQEVRVPMQTAAAPSEQPVTQVRVFQPVAQSQSAAPTTQTPVAPPPVGTQPVAEEPLPIAPAVPEDPSPLDVVLDTATGGVTETVMPIL